MKSFSGKVGFAAIVLIVGQLLLVGCAALGLGASHGIAGSPIAPPGADQAVPQGGKELWLYSLDIVAYLIAYAAGSIGKGWVRGRIANSAEKELEA